MPNPLLSFSKDDFNEAVKLAAWGNYEADCALADIDPEHRESWKDAEDRYIEEAASLLRETGGAGRRSFPTITTLPSKTDV